MRGHRAAWRLLLVALALTVAVPLSAAPAEELFQSAPGPETLKPKIRPHLRPRPEAAPPAPTPAPPALPPVTADFSYTRRAPSGVLARVIEERSNDANCAPRPIDLRIVEPPRNGTATVREEASAIPARGRSGANLAACVGRPVPGEMIYYQSNPGFHGADQLVYLISAGGSGYLRVLVQISVE